MKFLNKVANIPPQRRIRKVLTKLKQKIQSLVAYEAQIAHQIGLTPNMASSIGIAAAIVSTYFYWSSQFNSLNLFVAIFFLLASGFLDALDGVIARLHGETTVFGGFLDSMLDRYADAFVLIGLVLGGFADVFWGLLALAGSLLVSYSRARSEAAGIKMETIGLAERAERILIVVAASLLTFIWSSALRWSIVLLAFLTNLTVLQRAAYFRKASRKREAVTPII